MSELKNQLNQDMKTAMREGERARRDTLRLLLAAIKQVEVDQQTSLSDEEVLGLLQKEAKKRQETISDFAAAGRPEAAAGEQAELALIETYLPAQVTADEIREHAQSLIAELGVSGPRAIGQVMGPLMAEFQGRADGKLVNQIVRQLLSG